MSRTITTAAELDALPAGSVVLDRWGCARQKGRDSLWHAVQHHMRTTAARGPVLVLQAPSGPAGASPATNGPQTATLPKPKPPPSEPHDAASPTPQTPTDRRSTTVTRAHFKRPVWTWFCDRCGKTGGDLASEQRDLPTTEQMRRRGWFIAKTWGDRCPECVKAERVERAS